MSVFKGSTDLYQYSISDVLASNLKSWISYGLLETGAYTQIKFSLPTSGYTTLQSVHDDRYRDGQVYEGFGPSWVWEQDISPNNNSLSTPFRSSGVYVNNTFYNTLSTSGLYSHIIDFERGRVVFNSPVLGKTVKAEYTIEDVGVYVSDSKQWKTIVEEYSEQYSSIGASSPSGISSILKEKRVWLPSVFVEIQNRDHIPLQIGGGEYAEFNVFYHIFSDRPSVNKALTDLINDQEGKTLNLYNPNYVPPSLKYDGSIGSGTLTYNVLSNRNGPYFWRNAWISKSTGRTYDDHFQIYRGEVKHTILIERYGYPGAN